jgi:DNA processing protein
VSVGTNQLIRDGATPLLEPQDLLQQFPELAGQSVATTTAVAAPAPRLLPEALSSDERQLAELLGPEAVHPDELANRSQRPIGEVLGLLSGLEIAGVVEQRPGRVFRRI